MSARQFQAGLVLVLLGFLAPWIVGFGHLLHASEREATLSPLTTTLTAAAALLVGLSALLRDWTSARERPVLVTVLVAALLLVLLTAPLLLSTKMVVEYGASATMMLETGVALSWLTLALLTAARRRRTDSVLPGLSPELLVTLALAWLLRAAAVGDLQPWSLAAALLLMGAGLVALAASAGDFTENAEADAERASETEQGLRAVADAYAALDRQRQSVTHDARNVFLALRIASSTLAEHGDQLSPDDRHRLRTSISEEITHLEHLITATQPAEAVTFDAVTVVSSVIELERLAGLEVIAHLEPARAVGVPGDLARVVRNLLVNARNHAAGSTVKVEVRATGPVVRIVIRDAGPGIPTQVRRTLYSRGGSGTESNGSGLGLHISRALMQQQGGSLELAEGPGTRFFLTLPAAASHLRSELIPEQRGLVSALRLTS